MRVTFTKVSSNAKTGPIPVSMTEKASCADACPLKLKGCYAKSGPLAIHWSRVSERGLQWSDFCAQVAQLPAGTLWRHNQAGDLPGEADAIDGPAMQELVQANTGKLGFTYTHKPMTLSNAALVTGANQSGFCVNLSADNMAEADELAKTGNPVVVLLPTAGPKNGKTPEGRQWVVCPAQLNDKITCASCRMCARINRPFIIGFRAHGTGKKAAEQIAMS